MKKLNEFFTDGIVSRTLQTVGAEIETQFVDKNGSAIQTQVSQAILINLVENCGWTIDSRKGNLITCIIDKNGNKMFYELGRHNIEVATGASTTDRVLGITNGCLDQLYKSASIAGAEPYLAPILETKEDLLVIPDERDAIWLQLDGRDALAPLACTSSTQFTFSVSLHDAISILNKFGGHIDSFMLDYPQDAIWKRYIKDSSAGYLPNRYGGPLKFESINDYCLKLAQHDVVRDGRLVPFSSVNDLDVSLYVRSIWWHFRLKRYGNDLCIEVRPMARRVDEQFKDLLEKVLQIIYS